MEECIIVTDYTLLELKAAQVELVGLKRFRM